MNLVPYMVYVDYEHNEKISENKTLGWKNIILEEKIPYDEIHNFFYTKNHFRKFIQEESQEKMLQIGFKIEGISEKILRNTFLTIEKPGEKDKRIFLTFCKINNVWFQRSKFQNNKINGEYEFSNRSKDMLWGMSHSGHVKVVVYNENEKVLLEEDVLFFPSSISNSDYEIMMSDLFKMREEFIKNKKSTVSVGTQRQPSINTIEQIIDTIDSPLRIINKNPAKLLRSKKGFIKENSIHRYSPVTEMQKEIFPGQSKYKASTIVEETAIYENRVIKQELERLLSFCEFFGNNSKVIEKEVEQRLAEGKAIVKNSNGKIKTHFMRNGKFIKDLSFKNLTEIKSEIENEIKEKRKKIENRKHEIHAKLNEIKKNNGRIKNKKSLQTKLKVKLFAEQIKIKTDFNNDFFTVRLLAREFGSESGRTPPFQDYEYKKNNEWIKPFNKLENKKWKSYFCEIKNDFIDFKDYVSFFRAINEAKLLMEKNNENECDIEIIGTIEIDESKNINGDDIVGEQNNHSQYKVYLFNFRTIDSVLINDNKHSFSLGSKDFFEDLSDLLLDYDEQTKKIEEMMEILNFEKQTIFQLENLLISRNNINDEAMDYEWQVKKLNELLDLKIWKDNSLNYFEPVRPTQLFLNDPYYKLVWKALQNIEEEIGASIFPNKNEEKFGVKKVDEIFEIWSFTKMVNILNEEMGWTIVNNETLLENIDSHLITNKKLKGLKVILRQNEWQVEINYEPHVYLKGGKHKEPDYQFVFSKNFNGVYKELGVAYLDAKYRNYSEQGGEKNWAGDIKKYAINKYGAMVHRNNPEREILASFLLHSDIEFGKSREHTGENYNAVYNRALFAEIQKNRANAHKYGSIYLLPGLVHPFKKWFKMIMEYRLSSYEQCWACGEKENISKEMKYTSSGFPKYHFTCNNNGCKQFWVKNHCKTLEHHNLIKHTNNYHCQSSNNNDWYVECPACTKA